MRDSSCHTLGYHCGVSGKLTGTSRRKKKWLSRVVDGELGVPCLHFRIPLIARKRLKYRVPPSNLFRVEDRRINSVNQINSYFKYKLQNSCYGAGFRDAWRFPSAHSWVSDGTSLMSGRYFVNAIHFRYGVLYSRTRGARGRGDKVKDLQAWVWCGLSLNHILQICHHTHFVRIKRHDVLVNYVGKVAQVRGITVHKEPQYNVGNNVLKPDLVV